MVCNVRVTTLLRILLHTTSHLFYTGKKNITPKKEIQSNSQTLLIVIKMLPVVIPSFVVNLVDLPTVPVVPVSTLVV